MKFRSLSSLIVVIFTSGCASAVLTDKPDDAVAVVAALLDRYDVIGIPENHRAAEVHVFLRRLIADRRIYSRIQDVVVEFGNARYQSTADRYIRGGEVASEELRRIWRDTGQFLVWDSPLYKQFFDAVRSLNATLPPERQIRVILGDPPIPWEEVNGKAQYERFADRDLFFADVVEREVLARNHKAILIAGGTHMLNARPGEEPLADRRRSLADLIRRRHPGRLFSFWATPEGIFAANPPLPAAVEVRGSSFEGRSFGEVAPKNVMVRKVVNGERKWVPLTNEDWPAMERMADGLIDYGVQSQVLAPPETYCDAAYVAELRRRARILSEVYGLDMFTEDLDAVTRTAVCP